MPATYFRGRKYDSPTKPRECPECGARAIYMWTEEWRKRANPERKAETELNKGERGYLRRALQKLRIPKVDVRINPQSKGDIYIELRNPTPVICCGQKWIGSNPTLRKTKLTHELLHAAGMRHGREARKQGYYSNPKRDRYSPIVYRQICRARNPKQPEGYRFKESDLRSARQKRRY